MKLKGTITVFLSFLLVFVTGLFFTMSEVVRYWCLQGQAERAAALACESTMADYCRPLWEEFGILGLDGGYGETALRKQVYNDRLAGYMEKNGRPEGVSFFAQYPVRSELGDYHLLTDEGCAGLIREGAQKFKDDFPETTIRSVLDLVESISSDSSSSMNLDAYMSSGQRAMEAAEKNKNRKENEEEEIPDDLLSLDMEAGDRPNADIQKKIDAAENPIENAGDTSPGFLLNRVMCGQAVSGAVLSDDRPSIRTCSEGTAGGTSATYEDGCLFRLWVSNTLQDFRHDYGREGLRYETEYIICGHSSDRENLRDVVEQLIILREAANFTTIMSSSSMRGQAEAMAYGIAAAMQAPWLADVLKGAIIASWAHAESMLDVRRLLAGGRISLHKTETDWTTPIWMILSYENSDRMANDCGIGLTYTGYLRILLFSPFLSTKQAAERSCDIMESSVRQDSDYVNFRMDNCIYEVRTWETYQARPLFLSYVLMLQNTPQSYTFEYPQALSYITLDKA